MSDSFDPYYIWLGIPPKDQPPNHYRLLGLQDQEENPDVIDAAANRQTTYLHEMAAGPNRQESQQLLNEIAAARRCLLNPEKKQEYDKNLQVEQASSPPAAVPVAVPVAQVVPPPAAPVITPVANPVNEVPNFDFGTENSSEPAVSIDTGQIDPKTQSSDFIARPDDQPVAELSGVSSSALTSAAKKTGPKRWIIAGCSITAVAVAAFAFSNGTEEPEQQPTSTTAKSEEKAADTTPASDASTSPGEESAKAADEAPKKKSKPSMFDQVDEAESIFSLPSSFGSKGKKKAKKK